MSLPIACEILRVECTKPFFFVVISYPKGHICKETNVCSVTSNNDTASMFISVSVPNP